MNQRNGVGLDWSTFFNLTKEEKEKFLKQVKVENVENFKWDQYRFLFDFDRQSLMLHLELRFLISALKRQVLLPIFYRKRTILNV